MKKLMLISICFLSIEIHSFAQRETDIGFAGGAGYYMGDINPSQPFYSPDLNLGFIYRYNLNSRYVLKFEANYVTLKGNDLDFDNQFQQARAFQFTNSLLDLSIQFEFNFLPLKFDVRKMSFTPFVSSGAAYAKSLNYKSFFALPFALGSKVSFGKNWTFGMSWNFRKTFSDKIDNLQNGEFFFDNGKIDLIGSDRSIFNNNDWYSFANIFITYKIFDFRAECPAYMRTY